MRARLVCAPESTRKILVKCGIQTLGADLSLDGCQERSALRFSHPGTRADVHRDFDSSKGRIGKGSTEDRQILWNRVVYGEAPSPERGRPNALTTQSFRRRAGYPIEGDEIDLGAELKIG
jgi:hypothetical protein